MNNTIADKKLFSSVIASSMYRWIALGGCLLCLVETAIAAEPWQEMNRLINNEWCTRIKLKADKDGRIVFRGFKGRYRIRWRDANAPLRWNSVSV